MRIGEEDIRWLIAAPLVVLMAAVAVSMWFIDILARQSQFASLLAVELVAMSLLLYLERTPSYSEVGKAWMLVGCALLVFLLFLAMK